MSTKVAVRYTPISRGLAGGFFIFFSSVVEPGEDVYQVRELVAKQ